jgi:hypothetical protein
LKDCCFGSVLHPSIHLAYFEDSSKWDLSIPIRARVLLEHLYDVYKADMSTLKPPTAAEMPAAGTSVFLDAIRTLSPAQQCAAISELDTFFNGTHPCVDGNALLWWKVGNSVTSSLVD